MSLAALNGIFSLTGPTYFNLGGFAYCEWTYNFPGAPIACPFSNIYRVVAYIAWSPIGIPKYQGNIVFQGIGPGYVSQGQYAFYASNTIPNCISWNALPASLGATRISCDPGTATITVTAT